LSSDRTFFVVSLRKIRRDGLKKLLLIFAVTLAGLGMVACTNGETMVLLDEKITAVKVAESNGFGGMNEEILKSFEDKQSLKIFERAITSAVEQPGQLDISEPEYDIMVEYDGAPTHALHLWLGDEGQRSTFMYLNDEVVYLSSKEMTGKLRELILGEE
jgi:hypothetical protein